MFASADLATPLWIIDAFLARGSLRMFKVNDTSTLSKGIIDVASLNVSRVENASSLGWLNRDTNCKSLNEWFLTNATETPQTLVSTVVNKKLLKSLL